MRKLAKLTIFFSLVFIIIFTVVTGIRFLSLRVDWAKNLPPKPETSLTLLITAAHWALTVALFLSIVIALNYSIRKSFFALMSLICVMLLSFLFSFGISTALDQWRSVPPAKSSGIALGGKGLILSNTLNKNETAVILLNGASDPLGPRVVAIPNQPLAFQRSASADFDLPPVPFGDDAPWFLKDIEIDIRLNAEMFQRKFSQGFLPYLIYVGSLIYLLCSLGYVLKFSAWPLANLFLSILAFRGILALNTFFNSQEMQMITASFLDNRIPVVYALPFVFLGFGTLVNLYSLLAFAAKRRVDDGD
ncbi:hypothetical protein R84B8_00194 [Treponema sp. R8-4-B8]